MGMPPLTFLAPPSLLQFWCASPTEDAFGVDERNVTGNNGGCFYLHSRTRARALVCRRRHLPPSLCFRFYLSPPFLPPAVHCSLSTSSPYALTRTHARAHCIFGGVGSAGQACFWFNNGCDISCDKCDGMSGKPKLRVLIKHTSGAKCWRIKHCALYADVCIAWTTSY